MPALHDLLEMRTAAPADLSPDGSVALVASDLGGTAQLYLQALGGRRARPAHRPARAGRGVLPAGERARARCRWTTAGTSSDSSISSTPGRVRHSSRSSSSPRFFHRTPCASRDGQPARVRVEPAQRRRLGRGTSASSTPARSASSSPPGGWCDVAGFSPDGATLAVLKATERSGDNDLYLVDSASGEWFCAVPHDDDSEVGPPAWLASGRRVPVRDQRRPRHDRHRALRARRAELELRARGALGSPLRDRRERAARCSSTGTTTGTRGSSFATRVTLELRREVRASRPRRRRRLRLLARRPPARVPLLLAARRRATSGSATRRRARASG